MEGIGSEVSQKIKAAIKAKLIELGAYVDDELPDYIMVMVANKRTRSQMEDDLRLFLNNNTKVFTVWLYTVLQKLQEVTVGSGKISSSKQIVDQAKEKKKESDVEKKVPKKHKEKKSKKGKHKSKDRERKRKNSDSEKKKDKKKAKGVETTINIRKEVEKDIIERLQHMDHGNMTLSTRGQTINLPPPEVVAPKDVGSTMKLVDPEELQICNPKEILHKEAESSGEKPDASVSAPTVKLLAEHNRNMDKTEEDSSQQVSSVVEESQKKKSGSVASSNSSMSAEEIRKQLLLSRAKKQLEQRNLASRMRSNSPEVVIVEEQNVQLNSGNVTTHIRSQVEGMRPQDTVKITITNTDEKDFWSDDESSSHSVKAKRLQSRIVTRAEEDEPEIQSTVLVKPREFIPADKQANKNLILKAVAAAERSVAAVKPRKMLDEEKPRALFTRDLREKRYERIAVTLDNSGRNRRVKPRIDWETSTNSDEGRDELLDRSQQNSNASDKEHKYIHSWLEGIEKATNNDDSERGKKNGVNDWEDESSDEDIGRTKRKKLKTESPVDADDACIVVTMHGSNEKTVTAIRDSNNERFREFDKHKLERYVSADNLLEFKGKSEVKSESRNVKSRLGKVSKGEENLAPSASVTSKENCKFWPDCAKGRTCEYYHPSTICKFLPDCKYKDKCLYVHPPCKFPNCQNRDCFYDHKNKNNEASKGLCKFEPFCKNVECPYIHSSGNSKSCRFGSSCKNIDCKFSHSWETSSSGSRSPVVRV